MKVCAFVLMLTSALGLAFGQENGPQPAGPALGNGGCRNLPPIDPNKDFLGNFNNSCYALTLVPSPGQTHAGDLNAKYGIVFYKTTPGYELVVLGTFPNARFFSVTVYDAHQAETSAVLDSAIAPLTGTMANPFVPNRGYVANQQYGITVGFGDPVPVSASPGCSTADTAIDQNFLDASQIHQGLSWNGYPGLPRNFPPHLSGPSVGGQVIVRTYDDVGTEPAPVVMVRNTATGCAEPLQNAGGIVTTDIKVGGKWGDSSQTAAHHQFSYSIEQDQCFPQDPMNQVRWNRSSDYIPGENTASADLGFNLSTSRVRSIISGKQFMRLRFQLPQLPNTPCTNGVCALTGNEQLRYRSISFENSQSTLLSVKDSDFVQDGQGNVDMIIGFGAQPPAAVTAANGYTYFDLSAVAHYRDINAVTMRDILPNIGFQCANSNVPYFYTEYNPEGGYMGNYVPTVDFVTASQIPATPVPVTRANTCAATVTQKPAVCAVQ